jgi:hypothetical protein
MKSPLRHHRPAALWLPLPAGLVLLLALAFTAVAAPLSRPVDPLPGTTAPLPTSKDSTADYTFQSDRAYFHPADLRGVTFHPREYRSGGDVEWVEPGGIAIVIGQVDLKVAGIPGLDSIYYLADIQKSQEGFVAEILDRKHPSVPQTLIIHTDEESFVQRFTLYTLNKGWHEFLLPDRPAVDRARLDSVFTNRMEFHLETYDSSFAFTFVPFLFEAHVALQSGIELLDGQTLFHFSGDSVIFEGSEGREAFSIREIDHSSNGEPGRAGTRYRIGLELKQGGKRGTRTYMALFFDVWQDLEYLVWGPSRYYPRP